MIEDSSFSQIPRGGGTRSFAIAGVDCFIVVELPQTPEDDLRGARAVRGRQTS